MQAYLFVISASLAARPHWAPYASEAADYNLAVEALDACAFKPAEEVLRDVIHRSPDCGLCRQALAITLVRQERPEEALQLLRPLAEDHPNQADVFSLMAVAARTANQPATAREAAVRAVTLQPAQLDAQRSLLSILLTEPDLDAAQAAVASANAHLQPAAQACLRAELLLSSGQVANAQRPLEACVAAHPQLGDELALKRAHAEGDLAAFRALVDAQHLAPLRSKSSAAVLLEAGDIPAAAAALDDALQQRPGDIDALLLRAWCRWLLGQPESAEQDLIRLLTQPPAAYTDEQGRLFVAHNWRALRRQGLSLYVTVLADSQRTDEARRRLSAERGALGEGPALAAADVVLLLAEGADEAAASAWAAAAGRWPASEALAAAAVRLDRAVALSADGLDWLSGGASPAHLLQLAEQRHQDGDHDGSMDALAQLGDHDERAVRHRALQLAHRSAVAAEDLPSAERLRQAMAADRCVLDAPAALRHAWLLGEAGEDAAALALLGGAGADAAATDQQRSLAVWLLTRTGQLSPAAALVAEGTVEAGQVANLAVALYADGQRQRGRAMMAEACARMDSDEAGQCAETLSQM